MVLLSFILSLTITVPTCYFVILILQDYTTFVCMTYVLLAEASGSVVKEGAAEMTYAPAGCALETCNYLVPLQLPT